MLSLYERAKQLAAKCADAYSAGRYRSWQGVASALLKAGHSELEAEAIMRSKWARWAADMSGRNKGVPTKALIDYINPKNGHIQKDSLQKLVQMFVTEDEIVKPKPNTAEAVEIKRLRDIITRAQKESQLVEHGGKPMLLVPYWFVKAK